MNSPMKWLVTAGNTVTHVDKVRCITNVFSGRTGATIAVQAAARGHSVVLLTSHPEVMDAPPFGRNPGAFPLDVDRFLTFDELARLLRDHVAEGGFDAVVHCAAVGDYECAGVFAPDPGTVFDPVTGTWTHKDTGPPALVDRQAGKVKSNEPELWLRLVQTPKLVDQIRQPWGFQGLLVKFKLEVDMSDDQLLDVAEASRKHSAADLMVANTLEGMATHAFIGPIAGGYERVARAELAQRLVAEVERRAGSPHGSPSANQPST
ncbi:MAG: phosphopantothenoylcysteine decarboxylase [Isosphaeraceae bacterium]